MTKERLGMRSLGFVFLLAVLSGCGDDTEARAEPDAGRAPGDDAAVVHDASARDASMTLGDAAALVDAQSSGDAQARIDGEVLDDAGTLADARALLALGDACVAPDACESGACVDGVCCESACSGVCEGCAAQLTGADDGRCMPFAAGSDPEAECGELGVCATGTCSGERSCGASEDGTVCRESQGECDPEEVCSGESLECPSDAKTPANTQCRESAGECDRADVCDGTTNACVDAYEPKGMTCTDVRYVCSGESATCTTSCATDHDCAPAYVCVASACTSGRRAFTTSTTTQGNLGGLAGGDAFCQARAVAAQLRGNYVAWLSTLSPAVSAASRVPSTTMPYYLMNGSKLVDNKADLVDGNIDVRFDIDENGTQVASNFPYTGTTSAGDPSSENGTCNDWTSSVSEVLGAIGLSTSTTGNWTHYSIGNCSVERRLLCLQN